MPISNENMAHSIFTVTSTEVSLNIIETDTVEELYQGPYQQVLASLSQLNLFPPSVCQIS